MKAQSEIRRTESRLCRGRAGGRPLSRGLGPPCQHHPCLTRLEPQSPTQTPELQPQGTAEKLCDWAVGGQAPPGRASPPGGTLAWQLLSPQQERHQNDSGGCPPGPQAQERASRGACAEVQRTAPGHPRPGCGCCEPRDPRQLSAAHVRLQTPMVLLDECLVYSQSPAAFL